MALTGELPQNHTAVFQTPHSPTGTMLMLRKGCLPSGWGPRSSSGGAILEGQQALWGGAEEQLPAGAGRLQEAGRGCSMVPLPWGPPVSPAGVESGPDAHYTPRESRG